MACKLHRPSALLHLPRAEWDAATLTCSCGYAGPWVERRAGDVHADYIGEHRTTLTFTDGCTSQRATPAVLEGFTGSHACQPTISAYSRPKPAEVDCMYCGLRLYLDEDGHWSARAAERAGQLRLEI